MFNKANIYSTSIQVHPEEHLDGFTGLTVTSIITITGWNEIWHMDHKEVLFYTSEYLLEKCDEMHIVTLTLQHGRSDMKVKGNFRGHEVIW